MKRAATFVAGVALLGLVGFALATPANAKNATVTVVNQSDWVISQFFLSSDDEDEWGPDQLGEDVIGTGDSFKLKNVPCDTYDVKLIDEDEDECIVEEVDICGGKEVWTITSKLLLSCQEASE